MTHDSENNTQGKVKTQHTSLARVGYATEHLSYAWITKTIIVISISTSLYE